MATEVPTRIVRCPACGGDSVYAASNVYRPFCSARCKGVDLGAWASEGYAFAAPPPREDDAQDDVPGLQG
jgi:hypothetical protein